MKVVQASADRGATPHTASAATADISAARRSTMVRIALKPVRILRVAPLIALLALVAEQSLRPMAESDLFFRIKAGQEILTQHRLPGRNLFSFTYPDYPDVDAAWLFEVGAAALYGRGGFAAVVIAKAVVLTAAFALAFALCRRRGAGPAAAAFALAPDKH